VLQAGLIFSVVLFCGSFLLAPPDVELHLLWLMVPGTDLIGGTGLDMGSISPVCTLIK
jgi:hypothetical protein